MIASAAASSCMRWSRAILTRSRWITAVRARCPTACPTRFPSTPLGFSPRYFDPATGANSSLNTPFYQTIHTPLTRQYNLGLQYEFLPSWVLEVGYVGSSGINQANYNHNYNLAQLASPSNPINGVTTNTQANAVYRVPYLGYQPAGVQGTEYDATYHYNSLQVTVRKQFSHGLLLQAAYTWSKDLTELQQCAIGCVGDGQTNSNNPANLAQQMGPAAFSHPQRFVLSYNYQLPFGHAQGALGKLSNGWSIAGTTIVRAAPRSRLPTRLAERPTMVELMRAAVRVEAAQRNFVPG